VSIDGDTIVVGARYEDGGAGDPVLDSGAVYIFERDQGGLGNWGEVKILHASDAQAQDHLSRGLVVNGDLVVAGAWDEDGGPGNPAPDAGAVYIYGRNQGGTNNWGEVRILHASDMQAGDLFGFEVVVYGDLLVIGAHDEDGGPGDPYGDAGAVYISYRNWGGPDNWGEVMILHASDAQLGDEFGNAVAFDGTTVAIGAHFEDGAREMAA
jgi:hypothetical protein